MCLFLSSQCRLIVEDTASLDPPAHQELLDFQGCKDSKVAYQEILYNLNALILYVRASQDVFQPGDTLE